jgi:erythritol transport system ATP-binding protein
MTTMRTSSPLVSSASSAQEYVLEAEQVTKAYPGTVALKGVDFRLRRGGIRALIGENGAGKSTLVKVLAGVETPTSGQLRLDGAAVRFASARDAAARGIGIIHQELQLFPDLSIAENLFVGRERVSRWGTVQLASQAQAARDVLRQLGQELDPRTRLGALPLGLRQIVEIAKALVHDVRVLLMDEPTSALSLAEVEVLFRTVADLAARGVSIVYISHRLEELLHVADAVTVLRDGLVVGDEPCAAIDVPWIVERMTGRSASSRVRANASANASAAQADAKPILSVKALSLAARPGRVPLQDISFDLQAGEIVGIYGLMGAGRTELLESLMGVHADAAGRIALEGRELGALDVGGRVKSGLAFVPEDRQRSGLVSTMSVAKNMTLSSLGQQGRGGYVSPSRERAASRALGAELRLKTPSIDAPVTALSGGNQQKVVIARALMSGPRVLLMDEPSRGVDVGARAEIIECMTRCAGRGMGVLFASSDVDEILAAASRVLVMSRGRVTAAFDAHDVTEAQLASAASAHIRQGGISQDSASQDWGIDARA